MLPIFHAESFPDNHKLDFLIREKPANPAEGESFPSFRASQVGYCASEPIKSVVYYHYKIVMNGKKDEKDANSFSFGSD